MKIFNQFLFVIYFPVLLFSQSQNDTKRIFLSSNPTREEIASLFTKVKSGEHTFAGVTQKLSTKRANTKEALSEILYSATAKNELPATERRDIVFATASIIAMRTPEAQSLLRELTSPQSDSELRGIILNQLAKSYELAGKDKEIIPTKEIIYCFILNLNDSSKVISLKKSIRQIAQEGLETWAPLDASNLRAAYTSEKSTPQTKLNTLDKITTLMNWNKSTNQFEIHNFQPPSKVVIKFKPHTSFPNDSTQWKKSATRNSHPDAEARVNRK